MDPVLFESQDHQVDSIQVTRVEKWVLLRFLFPDKLKLKKDNGNVTSLPVSCCPHSCDNGFFSRLGN